MKILIVSQHFPPERGAVRRLYEFARYFAEQGHSVSVLTAMPNYPDGIVPEKYRGHFFYFEEMEGVKVYRTWVLPASNRDPGRRMIGFITFLFTGLINSFRIKEKPDIVLASTPPPVTPVMGWLLAKIRRARFVIEVRDLQPESSEDFGNLKKSWFTRTLKAVMHGLYRRADQLVAVTDGIATGLKATGVPGKRIATIKSGFSIEFSTADSNGIRRRFGWEDKFIILRAGTLGWAHSLETVIEAARHFTNNPEVLFVFVGDGEKRGQLEGMVRDYGLKNVSFIGSQPLESIPYFLKTSDVLIESIREVPITRGTFPAKRSANWTKPAARCRSESTILIVFAGISRNFATIPASARNWADSTRRTLSSITAATAGRKSIWNFFRRLSVNRNNAPSYFLVGQAPRRLAWFCLSSCRAQTRHGVVWLAPDVTSRLRSRRRKKRCRNHGKATCKLLRDTRQINQNRPGGRPV
jgi:colanic acid biosynthesis glycosyl transferase WcaI